MKTLVAAALLLAFAVPAHARNACDVEYDTQHDNYCLHNPSKCVDSRVDWKSVAARCGIAETETCTGRVTIHVVTDNGGLNPKGTKELSVGDCHIEDNKRILRTCPLGSFCRVEGTPDGDETLKVISVTRIDPYKEGMRDYREGLCYRARPYIDHGPEQELWIKGYHAHQTTKIGKHNDEHCFPRNATVKH